MRLSFDILDKRGVRFLLLAVGAMFTGLTLVMPSIGILEWITLIPAVLSLMAISNDRRVRCRGLYGYGFFFFFCFYLVNYHWFVDLYPLDFIDGMTKPAAVCVVLAGWVGLSIFQSAFGGLVFVIFGALARLQITEKCKCLVPVYAASLWAVFEWSQTLFWFGVPWGRLAIGQTDMLIGAQSASLLGSHFVTFLIVAVNSFAAYAIIYSEKRRLLAFLSAAIFVANTALGGALMLLDRDSGETVTMSAVQGNISSKDKWDFDLDQKTFSIYEEYTEEAALEGAEVVVWPETALPYNVDESTYKIWRVEKMANKFGVTILVGAFTRDEEGNELNSIIAVLPDGSRHETVYSKRHIVPFGEYVPLRDLFELLIPQLTDLSMREEDLTAGDGANVIYLDEAAIGALICFDSIYDELARDSVRSGAQVLTISTNDSWFVDSAALDMHNAQAKLRAIENRRYVVRSANTGISSMISPTGKEISSIDALEDGQIIEEMGLRDNLTLYTRVGNLFVYLCIAFVCVAFITNAFGKFRKKAIAD